MLDRKKVKEFRKEISEVLEKYGKEKGVQIELGNIRFDNNSFTGKIKVILAENEEKAEQIEWNKYCNRFNLKEKDYGKIVDFMGQKYRIVQLKPKSRKYPLIVETINTKKRYKFQLNEHTRKQIEKGEK